MSTLLATNLRFTEFAELQALEHKLMYMSDWIAKLDDFLKLIGRQLLTHAGKISHDNAVAKAIKDATNIHEVLQENSI